MVLIWQESNSKQVMAWMEGYNRTFWHAYTGWSRGLSEFMMWSLFPNSNFQVPKRLPMYCYSVCLLWQSKTTSGKYRLSACLEWKPLSQHLSCGNIHWIVLSDIRNKKKVIFEDRNLTRSSPSAERWDFFFILCTQDNDTRKYALGLQGLRRQRIRTL